MGVQLGTSGLEVSRIGLGLAALGRPAYINLGHAGDFAGETEVGEMEARAHAVLDAAYAAGVRYFDAARSYGRAEDFLGSWLTQRGHSPDDLTVGSKWGYTYVGEWRVDAPVHEVKDLSADTFRRQLAETRARLGPHLQLYQIHSATLESGVLEDPAVRHELAGLRADGVRIGFTTTGPHQADTIERALDLGGFDTVQSTWNLIESSAGPALAHAHRAGLGVIIKEAVANGRLTARGDTPLLQEVARRLETTPDALALAAVLAQPWVDVVLSGATTEEMLTSNLRAEHLAIDDAVLAELAPLREDPDQYWHERSELPWN